MAIGIQTLAPQDINKTLPRLEALENRLHRIRESLGDAGIRLRNTADRTVGIQPPTPAVAENVATPSPDASIHRLGNVVDNLEQELNYLFSQIERIETL